MLRLKKLRWNISKDIKYIKALKRKSYRIVQHWREKIIKVEKVNKINYYLVIENKISYHRFTNHVGINGSKSDQS